MLLAPPTPDRPIARPRQRVPEPGPTRAFDSTRVVVVAAGSIAIAYGLLLRLWLLAHLPLFGDEAVVGLMARGIDSGHFSAFYWGQHYGGLEPYIVAIVLPVGGGSAQALNATPALLCVLAAVLVGVVTFAVGRNRLLAFAAGCLVWVWPYAFVWDSVRELGFRSAALCCGLAAVACCVRAYRGGAGRLNFVVLGLALGLGWWASPEIVYFAFPCAVLLCGWWWNVSRGASLGMTAARPSPARPSPSLGTSLAFTAAGAIIGSLPWWYANLDSGFASLRRSALPANYGETYGARLSVFFHDMLPLQLGVRTVPGGAWVGGPVLGPLLYALVLVLVVAAVGRSVWLLAHRRDLAPLALAAAVVTFPFLYAAAPGTDYWIDGRYGFYLPALIAGLFGAVLAAPAGDITPRRHERSARQPTHRVLATAALAVLGAAFLTLGAAHAGGVPASPSLFSGWQSPDSTMQQVVDAMRTHHIGHAYGDYWTAYALDFLDHGSPVVSPSVLDSNRSAAIAAQVGSSKDPPWLFFSPAETATARTVFSNPQPGPGRYTEASFEALLRRRGIAFEVVKLGVLDAVVPARRLTTP